MSSTFNKFLHTDFQDPEVRDMVLEYFVDKIYVYDDKLTITDWYSEEKSEMGSDLLFISKKLKKDDKFGQF